LQERNSPVRWRLAQLGCVQSCMERRGVALKGEAGAEREGPARYVAFVYCRNGEAKSSPVEFGKLWCCLVLQERMGLVVRGGEVPGIAGVVRLCNSGVVWLIK
jgi:hypothetical protein